MSKKLTYQFVKEQIEKTGYTLLSEEYINATTKLDIQCSKKHKYKSSYKVFRQGGRCTICNRRPEKFSYEYIKDYIEKNGYLLLSKEYRSTHEKIKIRCPLNHDYFVSFNNFKKGRRCSICGKRKKYSYEYVKSFMEKDGSVLLSEEYKKAGGDIKVKCKNGHIYLTSFSRKLKQIGCPFCSGNARLTYQFVKATIEKQPGYKLLSKEYKNNHTKLKIKCDHNHIYLGDFNHFYQSNRRCPVCAEYGFDKNKPGSLYYIRISLPEGIFYKIGITNDFVSTRIKQIDDSAKILWTETFLFGEYAYKKEQDILKKYKKYLANNKNLNINSGYTEIFTKDVLQKDC
ncbi:MAG: hypothetical protein QNJ70_30410 [Xenococcaceae cyanobacterium MO_207.B15]|nr:hypothetical protein [Xenococcaceae cyanobacterium MO_207.B15]